MGLLHTGSECNSCLGLQARLRHAPRHIAPSAPSAQPAATYGSGFCHTRGDTQQGQATPGGRMLTAPSNHHYHLQEFLHKVRRREAKDGVQERRLVGG